ncbi:MAG: hypothetical protein K940chlam7_02125 [Chlamydiae bacterium]|nr:hypothetical protein [Chlamydiota bacterium]
MLIKFNRSEKFDNKADFGEKVGNIGLGLLRIGFGKTVNVEKITSGSNIFATKSHSTLAKIAAVALFILALPITALLAGIGCIGIACSNSHSQICNLYSDRSNTPEEKAAVALQKYIRGHLARKPLLPSSLFPQYHAQCEKAKGPESSSMPQALGGKTRVYLPKEMPEVVLKSSGRKDAIKRFHQMQDVRSILDSQNSTHLFIPKASLCGNFLVEQRLPINVDSYHNMGLYLSQPQLFDEAVREMTRLFSKIYLSDLVSYQNNPLGHIADVGDFVRYDNLPLYIEENKGKKEGKIGLIDLEHMQNSPSPKGLETLVRIFPLHLDVIKEEAKNLKMKINHNLLEAAANRGNKYLQVGFVDHLEWLKEKGLSTEVSLQPFEVSTERVTELTGLVEKELVKLNQGINDLFVRERYLGKPQMNFFVEDPDATAKEFAATITPMIVANIKAQIEKKQNKLLSKMTEGHMTESELVSLRSPVMKRPKLHKGIDSLIGKSPKIKFEKNGFCEKRNIAEQLAYVIIQELVKGGDLFFFDPAYYTGGHDLCWLRY